MSPVPPGTSFRSTPPQRPGRKSCHQGLPGLQTDTPFPKVKGICHQGPGLMPPGASGGAYGAHPAQFYVMNGLTQHCRAPARLTVRTARRQSRHPAPRTSSGLPDWAASSHSRHHLDRAPLLQGLAPAEEWGVRNHGWHDQLLGVGSAPATAGQRSASSGAPSVAWTGRDTLMASASSHSQLYTECRLGTVAGSGRLTVRSSAPQYLEIGSPAPHPPGDP